MTPPERLEWWIRLSAAGDLLAIVAAGSAFGLVLQGEAPPFLTAVAIGGGLIALAKRFLSVRWLLRMRKRSVR